MRLLLDSDSCINYLRSKDSAVARRLASTPRADVALCDVVKGELYYGAYHSARVEHNLNLLAEFFAQLISLPFDGGAAEVGGRIRANRVAGGRVIGPHDMQIAAIGLA